MSSISLTDRDKLAVTLEKMGWSGSGRQETATLPPLTGLRLVPERSREASRAEGAPAERAVRAFRPPATELSGRLRALIEWLARDVGGEAPFVADHDGLALAGETKENQDLIAVSSAMARLLQRIQDRSERACSALTLDIQGQTLQLTLVESGLGKFMVGLIVERPFTEDVRRTVDQAVRAALRA